MRFINCTVRDKNLFQGESLEYFKLRTVQFVVIVTLAARHAVHISLLVINIVFRVLSDFIKLLHL